MIPIDRVRQVALDLFAEHGYKATSMRDIARAAGFTPGAFYHHYPSKESILLDIMSSTMQRLMDSAVEAVAAAGDDPEQRLRALVRTHVTDHGVHQNSATVGDTELRALSPENRLVITKIRDAYEDLWRSAVSDLARQNPSAFNEALLRLALIQMCTGVHQWYRPNGPLELTEIADQFCEIAVDMVLHGERR